MSSEFEDTAVTMCCREGHVEVLVLLLIDETCKADVNKTIKNRQDAVVFAQLR
jgi:hypothetical protein